MKNFMIPYVALLRGIGPENPNTRNEKLRKVFEGLGFADVQTIISSGNVIFKSRAKDITRLESKIEKALDDRLGFKNPVIIRNKSHLERFIRNDPFKGEEHGRTSYLIITFLKKDPWEVSSALDPMETKTPSFMTKLEKKYGKVITTRTWKTVQRIVKKLKDFV
jgi:uncharacterized protein (DUF1697 family)